MSAEPARHLRVVDGDGQPTDLPAYVRELEAQLAGAEKDIRAWRTRYHNLKRDKDAEARNHKYFPQAKELFDYWRERCGHPRSVWTEDRFWCCLPYLKRDGLDLCKMGIDGLAWKPYETEVGGFKEVFDDFELLFKKRKTFERMCNRGARARKVAAMREERS